MGNQLWDNVNEFESREVKLRHAVVDGSSPLRTAHAPFNSKYASDCDTEANDQKGRSSGEVAYFHETFHKFTRQCKKPNHKVTSSVVQGGMGGGGHLWWLWGRWLKKIKKIKKSKVNYSYLWYHSLALSVWIPFLLKCGSGYYILCFFVCIVLFPILTLFFCLLFHKSSPGGTYLLLWSIYFVITLQLLFTIHPIPFSIFVCIVAIGFLIVLTVDILFK